MNLLGLVVLLVELELYNLEANYEVALFGISNFEQPSLKQPRASPMPDTVEVFTRYVLLKICIASFP